MANAHLFWCKTKKIMRFYHLRGSCCPRGFFLAWRLIELGGIQTHSGSLSVTLLIAQQTRAQGWKKSQMISWIHSLNKWPSLGSHSRSIADPCNEYTFFISVPYFDSQAHLSTPISTGDRMNTNNFSQASRITTCSRLHLQCCQQWVPWMSFC